jgi:hypothetical protein
VLPVLRRLRTAVVQALLFGVVGPPVGALCFFALALTEGPSSVAAEHLLFPRVLVIGAFLVFGAYVLGAIPALATGLVFGLLSHGRRWRFAMHAMVGAGSGLLVTALYQLVVEGMQGAVAAPNAMLLGMGTIAGGACAALGHRRDPMSRDER